MIRPIRWLLPVLACMATLTALAADKLSLKKDDHICIIGNTLADRMQHSGYLEALIHTRFPQENLVFRNLGFSGDELVTRLRSQGFGSPDEWLKHEKADVIFAFFGYNESFKGQAGIDTFKKDLEKFIQDTLKQDYSGKGAPNLVLFSPIAQEKHSDPNFPAPNANNPNIKLYAEAMAAVAKANNIQFVDLFAASQKVYSQSKQSLTINGIHLSDDGYKALAPVMFQALFNEKPASMNSAAFEKLRMAINDKNNEWFKRYRTVDGYNVYGGRSYEKYNGVLNRDTMQREMEIRDVMTANRDKRVWAIAQGGDLEVKDDNLPKPVEVKTNKPGKNPDGSHVFLSGEEAISKMTIPPGCKVELFASEEKFPELSKPVQMAFDTKGRLWVAAWPNYPERTPTSKDGDKLLVFEDTNNDGKADKCTTFLDDLNCPTGFQFYKDGVLIVQAPDVWFVRDTDGDGKADWKERILNGLDSADSHHTANALCLDPGGAIYLSDGVFHRTQIETASGPVRNLDAAIYRFDPRSAKFERYIPYGFANPHGRVFDAWGNDLVTDATGNNTYFGAAISGYLPQPGDKHPGIRQFWERPSRPCPGTAILSSQHFPEEFQGNFLNANVITFQGVYRVKVKEEGSGLWGDTLNPALISSSDPNFRPIALDVAPDGSVYILDWHNPIIGHLQHHLRDPSRDHVHGRIYRMTYEGRPLGKAPQIADAPIENLLELLKHPENNIRTRAKIELGARDTRKVISSVQKWAKQFSPTSLPDQHHLMEALWVHQWHNVVNESLLKQMLKSPEPRARAAAARVLFCWRDRVKDVMPLLMAAANDSSPRVRLEAVRAASYFKGAEAMDIAYASLNFESDYYLDYVFKQTTKVLQKTLKDVYLPKDQRALSKIVAKLTDKELLAAKDSEPILMERLERKNIELNTRNAALDKLAQLHKSDRVSEAIVILQRLDSSKGPISSVNDLGLLLTTTDKDALAKKRSELKKLATGASHAPVRRAALAGLVAADGKPDGTWASTEKDPSLRAALIDSIIMQADPSSRATFQPLLVGVLNNAQTPANVRNSALSALPLMGTDNAAKNFGVLASHLRDGKELTTASRAITQIPRDAWDKQQAGPVAEAILAWAKTIPTRQRTAQDFVETVQVGLDMAALLPVEKSAPIRKGLVDLGVRVFAIKTIREGMRYDTPRIVVEAGKPFEIIFENTDMMPHNLVIVMPGTRESVGAEAQNMKAEPDRNGRVYVPPRNKNILAATKLMEPGQKETLKLTAPKTPGDYEYVCTYPEHWKVMFGQMIVVKDLDAYMKVTASAPSVQAADAGHNHKH